MIRYFLNTLFTFAFCFLVTGCVERVIAPQPVLGPNQILIVQGDTLSGLAYKHGVSVRALAKANRLSPPYLLRTGQVLLLPIEKEQPEVAPFVPPTPVKKKEAFDSLEPLPFLPEEKIKEHKGPSFVDPEITQEIVREEKSLIDLDKMGTPEKNESDQSSFQWPLTGELLKEYNHKPGKERSDGISLKASLGTKVYPTQKGKIIYAGDGITEFGNLILIQHAQNWVSVYGYLSEINVRRDDEVTTKTMLGKSGKTGKAKTPQLYFELRKNKEVVDPLLYLSRPKAITKHMTR